MKGYRFEEEMGEAAGFERLEVWKRSARLSADLFRQLSGLRDFGFKDQVTRAGLSIPSNIAEGIERSTLADCVRFLRYAKGSCGELRTQVYIGMEVDYIERMLGDQWVRETRTISSLLGGLIRSKQQKMG